ncbi:phage tail tape measure protein [Pluralibacter gergoviae]|uniref:phage tail tape measure protein n=1 Tax=Pluralibacter gergoviae TaxID=61647 RepID=UPI0009BA6A89|nr:phage tail tape measure protein [Pluralibacter gergoviae]
MDLSIRVAFSVIDKLTRPVSAASKSIGGLSDSLKKTQSSIKDLEKGAASFEKLRNQANDTAQKLRNTQRSLDGLNQKQREGGQLTEAQTARLETLRNKLSRLTDTYSKQTVQLRTAAQAVRQHGVNISSGSGTIQAAIRRTEQYNQTLERERRQLAATTRAHAGYTQAKETAGKLRSNGMGMTLGAAAAGYAGGSFLAPAVGFDEEMSRVQALTRLNKDSTQLAALREQAKKLGAETAFTTRDAASGQAFLAMAGFTPQAIQAALPGVLNMALAGGMDLGESADIGSNILSQFTLPAGEMDRVSDVLTAAFTRTNTDLRNLGDTMKYAGPVASKLGISLEEAAGMAGILANNGLRGSDAGTAMRASLARLASPTAGAAKALKQLGVSVADSSGQMRPVETILSDLYKATSKFGQVDQVGFFKDIAGEEAFVGLQTLVAGTGSGALQKLIGELKGAKGEADAVAKKMADNLGGDLKNLDSAWEGFRIQVEETADGPLRKLTQGLSDVITAVSGWVKENPRLSQTLLLVGGAVLVLAGAIGIASLAASFILGPMAKLRMALSMIGISSITATGGIGLLGTAFSGLRIILGSLLGIPGLIAAAFVAAAFLIWRYWEPIKAFYSGVFTGIMQALEPIKETFSSFSPIFDSLSNSVKAVWQWFTTLLSPIQTSKDTLDKCTSAGETFGSVLGGAIRLVLTPTKALLDSLGWILEKLGVLPDEAERARKKIEDAQRSALLQDKIALLQGDMSKVAPKKTEAPAPVTPPPSDSPLSGNTGTQRRLQSIANNTKATADNTKKRVGPGDIIFKNLPRALALRGAYQETRISPRAVPRAVPRVGAPAAGGIISVPAATAAPVTAPVSAPAGGAPVFNLVFNDVGKRTDQELEKMVRTAVREALSSTGRSNRGSFRDRE